MSEIKAREYWRLRTLASDAVVIDGDESKAAEFNAKVDAIQRELEVDGLRADDFGVLEAIPTKH